MVSRAYDWISYHAIERPDRLAQVDLYSGRRYSYQEVQERTSRLAAAIAKAGVGQGDRVALLCNNSTDFLDVQFACFKLGAVFTPLNWRLTVPELTYILKDSDPELLIFEDVFADNAAALEDACRIPQLWDLNAKGEASTFERCLADAPPLQGSAQVTLDDISTIMYTSGTTGHPKGALITYGMTLWNVINVQTPHRLSGEMITLNVLPLFHTGGLNVYTNPALCLGGTVYVMRTFDPGETLAVIRDESIGLTHFFGVPAIYLSDFETTSFERLVTCGVGGAPTPVELLKIYGEKGKSLQQGFGMTETSPVVSALTAEMAMEKIGSAGLPVMHTEVRIVDETGADVEVPGTVGELWVRGPNITPGYWRNEEATAGSITDGWLHTGDACYQDDEGFLYIVDRHKDMYISGGENVYPAEIENVIYQLPAVAEVAIIGVLDEKWGETGQAIVVIKEGEVLAEKAILDHCQANLAKFKCPNSVRFVSQLPRNAAGKILKRELRQQ